MIACVVLGGIASTPRFASENILAEALFLLRLPTVDFLPPTSSSSPSPELWVTYSYIAFER